MNEYYYYTVNQRELQLKKCEKPDCFRLTTALYCCPVCDYADQKKFELEESGFFSHSSTCNERYEERKHLKIKD